MLKITLTESTYTRTQSGKIWKSKPDNVEVEEITREQHGYYTKKETLQTFRRLGGSERAQYGYTCDGYKVVKLISANPDRTEKKVREFEFKWEA